MSEKKTYKQFLDLVQKILDDGFKINENAKNYVESLGMDVSGPYLSDLIDKDSDSERDTLLELIFFPDLEQQLRIEAFLETARFTKNDNTQINQMITSSPLFTHLICDNQAISREIRIPKFAVAQFLNRLNITWTIEPEIKDEIDKIENKDIRLDLKVRLRNLNLRFNGRQSELIVGYLKEMDSKHNDFYRCLQVLLDLITGIDEDADLYQKLCDQKIHYLKALEVSQKFNSLIKRNNMETLMLQGVQTPSISSEYATEQMRLLDLICLKIFKKTASFQETLPKYQSIIITNPND